MAELTLIEAFASRQVVTGAERNLEAKLPRTQPAFRILVDRCLHVEPDLPPAELGAHAGRAGPRDLPILVAALGANCPWLVTFNARHYQPGHPDAAAVRPGEFVERVRVLLSSLNGR